ncbi:tyrosine-type recombinase/integrase [Fluviicola chungangensis]|uniref:Tyrosine-type recombinase/integrase n=1 Tax=Fluviicola chungangensis TaxID=2597671 RepID=A0A556MYC0_9FLAO|nr:tyrosine-type recombinase/integrase [Fluviicola chungangensis]
MKLKINFALKTGVTGEIPILAILNYGYKEFDVAKQKHIYKPLKYYTGVKVTKSNWNAQLKQPTLKSQQSELINIEKQINDVFNALNINGEITPTNLKSALDSKIKGIESESVKRIRIIDFIQNEIIDKTEVRKGTRENYNTLRKQLIKLEEKMGKSVYTHEFNEQYYNTFIEQIRVQNNRLHSVRNAYKSLRAVLRKIALKYKVKVFDLTLELPQSKKVSEIRKVDKVYLTYEQIQKLIDYEPENERYRNAKLIFLTLFFTGTRYSDVFKVKPEYHYSKNGIEFSYARFVTQKNNKEVIIPILKPLADAIKANSGKTAYRVHETQFNIDVKKIIELSGIKEEHTLSYTDSYGAVKFETKEFFKFVSSHTGRRSFVTNLINLIPVTILTKITSHELRDNSIIFSYNKISLLDNAVLFIRELMRLQETDKDHFTLRLV